MSSPVRGADGPLGYAPRWARTAESGRAELRTPMTARESPRDFKPPLVVMSLRKTVSPQEMAPSIFAAVGRLVGVMILPARRGVFGFLWLTPPRGLPPNLLAIRAAVRLRWLRTGRRSRRPRPCHSALRRWPTMRATQPMGSMR